MQDKNGVLYGVTGAGGANAFGTVYSLAPPSSHGGGWTFTVLHDFAGGSDGFYSQTGLSMDSNGVLYGVTYKGGTFNGGVAYSVTPPATAGGTWTEAVVHHFGWSGDGLNPTGIAVGPKGVLYGTTLEAGATCCGGIVFSLKPGPVPGNPWTETILYSFLSGSDGAQPQGSSAFDKHGVIYGTTRIGGLGSSHQLGTVFSLSPPTSPGGTRTKTTIYEFQGRSNADGAQPNGVVRTANGVLYGATGGGGHQGDGGTVYALTPPASAGSPWTERVLYRFANTHGLIPVGPLLVQNGVLYGTCSGGGAYYEGTVFSLVP